MGSDRRRGSGNIPDLGAPPVVRSKPPESEATSSDSLFGSATFDGDFEGGSLDLALDDAPDLRASLRAPASAGHVGSLRAPPSGGHVGDVIERTAESAQSLPPRSIPARPAKEESAWPTGTPPDSASLAVDPSEVALTAGFGPPPENAFAAIAYAARVVARRQELRARVRELNDRLTDAERDRDKLLATMLSGVRAELAGFAEGQRVLEPITRIETMAVHRLTALSGENADYERRAAELSREEASLQSERDANAKAVERAAAELATRQHEHQREEAKKKRLYIEVTAVLNTVEKAGGRPTAEQAAQLATREADIAAHKPHLDRAADAVAAANAAVESVQTTAKALEKRARDLGRQRAALAAESRKRIGAHTQSVDEAEAHLLLVSAEAARGVLAARGRLVDVPGAMLDAIQAADKMVTDRLRELERHVRALDAHDPEGLKTGILTASGILVAILLVAMVLLFR